MQGKDRLPDSQPLHPKESRQPVLLQSELILYAFSKVDGIQIGEDYGSGRTGNNETGFAVKDNQRISEVLEDGCGNDAPGSFKAWLFREVLMHANVMQGKRYDTWI